MTSWVASLGSDGYCHRGRCGSAAATVVIGGILSSTFLTLVLLPVLYEWAERRRAENQPGNEIS